MVKLRGEITIHRGEIFISSAKFFHAPDKNRPEPPSFGIVTELCSIWHTMARKESWLAAGSGAVQVHKFAKFGKLLRLLARIIPFSILSVSTLASKIFMLQHCLRILKKRLATNLTNR